MPRPDTQSAVSLPIEVSCAVSQWHSRTDTQFL
jgi:hypothetical protein